ncbi:hypothetical protein OH76DRAFT_1067950 [Lentinus brumalis]|uniref:Uncharacterized protein n=1 Tax=Lentinus brumalis TaxID=2498619 RepID=A0A371DNR7_9APHY|nr:hypothetical protein OH76DRAFT_1067950 [Polyporus brumalis]
MDVPRSVVDTCAGMLVHRHTCPSRSIVAAAASSDGPEGKVQVRRGTYSYAANRHRIRSCHRSIAHASPQLFPWRIRQSRYCDIPTKTLSCTSARTDSRDQAGGSRTVPEARIFATSRSRNMPIQWWVELLPSRVGPPSLALTPRWSCARVGR